VTPVAATPSPPAIDALDAMPSAAAAAALAPLFEGARGFLGRLVAARPFGSWPALFSRARTIALAMPEAEQVELVDAHPPLGAPPGSVSAHSFREHGYDVAAADAAAEAERRRIDAELAVLNAVYERRFGFRYCVFVAGRPRAELLPGLRAALADDRAAELRRALADVVAIAEDRHRRLSEEVGS